VKVISLKIPESYLNIIDEFVKMGKYASKHEFIRSAIRRLIEEEIEKSIVNSVWRELGSGKRKSITVMAVKQV
jgi:Arc/MetJ-type ribon-helix-helix transcriptional regulator